MEEIGKQIAERRKKKGAVPAGFSRNVRYFS